MTSVIDETLHITAGSALDVSGWRTTATPAGSKGRITASDGKLYEAGVQVKFAVATINIDSGFTVMPTDDAALDAGLAYLARCGYNCLRVMGIEHVAMRGADGACNFLPAVIDRFDRLLSAAKANGLYIVLCVMSDNLYRDMDGTLDRYVRTMTTWSKARMYTEQDVRDEWLRGFNILYNRVNPYTGANILTDPCVVLVEHYNEASALFCAQFGMLDIWRLARNDGATPAGQTWLEWLQDPAAAHGHADLAALNTSWGSAHATYTAAASAALPKITVGDLTTTQQSLDWVLYVEYLDANLADWYATALASTGYTGLRAMHTTYPQLAEVGTVQRSGNDDVADWHYYVNLTNDWVTGVATKGVNVPIWDTAYIAWAMLWASGPLPVWGGEMGDVSFSKWRHCWPIIDAILAAGGASSGSFYTQADFFPPALFNDEPPHGTKFSKLHAFYAVPSHVNDFVRLWQSAVWTRGDIPEMTATLDIPINARHCGKSPRNPARLYRYMPGVLRPLLPAPSVVKARLQWTDDTTDDTLATTWTSKAWHTLLSELQAAGKIAADHPSLVSATTNHGNITATAITGTVGGLAASATQPVFTLSAAHTLVDGDIIHIPTMGGTVGINLASAKIVVKIGTGNNVRAESGANLTSYSGYSTGTWCEGDNVCQAGNDTYRMSRRDKLAWVNVARGMYFTHSGASLPWTLGMLTVHALDADASMYVISRDGLDLTSSRRIIIGVCGYAENTGMTFSDSTRTTMTNTGDYPATQYDCTATLSLALTRATEWALYRLKRNGDRAVREAPVSYDATAGKLKLTLRTGTVQPACLWELVR